MTLVSFPEIKKEVPESSERKNPESLNAFGNSFLFSSKDSGVMTKYLGEIIQGQEKHFWSFGNFNMMRLVFWLLEQIGSAEIIMSTYSISPKTLQGVINRKEKGVIRDIRFIVDNRVRSISPKPFDLLVSNFDYKCISIHAKVACIWNEEWKISVVSSQNATDNPKMERGVIYTNHQVFDFDKKVLEDAFERGTT